MKMLIDLDHIPLRPASMKIRVSRRGMLAAAADAAEEKLRSSQGLPSYRIEDLSTFDDEMLGKIIPAVNRKAAISLDKGVVYAETSSSVDPIPLFALDSPALFIFNQFNGSNTIAEIGRNVAERTGWDEERARETVRSVFLKLCEVRVCEPSGSL